MTPLIIAYLASSASITDVDKQSELNAVAQHCKIHHAYYLRAGAGKVVTIHVRPEVRALPLRHEQLDCVAAELAKRGRRLADPPRAPKPATTADLQSHLDRIHYYCDLGPDELKAGSATVAFITIPPTMRVRPLTRRKHRCVKAQVERIHSVRLGRGIVPTVD